MPPWHLDKTIGIQEYKNDISLSDLEIGQIVSWVDAGAPEGDPANLPMLPHLPDGSTWQLEELLGASDFVSLHLPMSEETRGLIDREAIGMMKKGAILVNLARGGVIDGLDVLAEGLESGRLAGVGLDVFPEEPPDVSHRLFRDSRCLCAPHFMGTSVLAMDRIFRVMATGMVAVFKGEQPEYCVNPEVFE